MSREDTLVEVQRCPMSLVPAARLLVSRRDCTSEPGAFGGHEPLCFRATSTLGLVTPCQPGPSAWPVRPWGVLFLSMFGIKVKGGRSQRSLCSCVCPSFVTADKSENSSWRLPPLCSWSQRQLFLLTPAEADSFSEQNTSPPSGYEL